MTVKKVWAVYFSATDTTRAIVERVARAIADATGADYAVRDFTLPAGRENALTFGADELAVFGTPVIAGRVPNVLLKYLATISGSGALGVPIVLYGNRDYDDALIELRDILENGGLRTIAAGAFIGEHSFSEILAKERPDGADMAKADAFARAVADKLAAMTQLPSEPIDVKGTPSPYSGYYQPRDRGGNPVDIRKVKPITTDDCINCLTCADVCPMGSISYDDVSTFTGICIKCCACVKNCPVGAKQFTDEKYLYHKNELEEGLTRRAEPETFV